MLVGISDEKRVLPADKCRSPVGGHEKGLSPSWISYPLMQFLDGDWLMKICTSQLEQRLVVAFQVAWLMAGTGLNS